MFNFNQQPTSPQTHPPFNYNEEMEKRIRLSVDDVRGQLLVTRERFEDSFAKLQEGDDSDREYLADYQETLIQFLNNLDGALGRSREEVVDEVKRRLFVLSEELEKLSKEKN